MVQTMTAGCLRWVALATPAYVLVCALALAGAPSPSRADTPATPTLPYATGTVEKGGTKAAACAACHGPNGNSTNPEWPRLAGQNAVYIAQQLRLFRAGVRDNAVMKPMASTLSDQDINDLAVYYAAQTPVGLEADPSYWQSGQALYRRGDKARSIPGCIACHGPVGRGNLASGYPALQAQHSVYVIKQLTDYKLGARYRGAHPEQASPNAIMMFTIAKRLTPDDIRDVASYVQGLR
jgi:cytochrome c553